ncbi:MAG: DUF2341 domain-containing protein [Candidatus Aenigmarchaeota archaeon]|nr:DUF2341 domain-containing protein [Candidatus Aenigmarchaeota archaeon]
MKKGILVLSTIFLFIYLIHTSSASIGWWNENWKYRTQIVIISGEDFPYGTTINITLDTTDMINKGVMKSDCSDVRFVNSTSNYLYNFSVLLCNSSKTIFTIKMLQGFRNDTINEIYMYYGNPNAKKISKDFNEIYWTYFEDFNNCSGDCEWRDESSFQEYKSGNVIFLPYDGCYENSSVFVLDGGKENWWKTPKCWSPENLETYKVDAFLDFKITFNIPSILDIWISDDNASDCRTYPLSVSGIGLKNRWQSNPRPTICAEGICNGGETIDITSNRWYNVRFIINSSGEYIWINKTLYLLEENYSLINSTPWKLVLKYNEGNGENFEYLYIDNVRYRYKPDTEPIVYILPRESNKKLLIYFHNFSKILTYKSTALTLDIKSNENEYMDKLSFNDFNISVDGESERIADFKNFGNGTYTIALKYNSSALGEKELKVEVVYGNYSGSNATSFYWLLNGKSGIKDFAVVSDDNWKNVIAASATGLPVLIGDTDLTGENVSGVFVLGDVTVGFNGDIYTVDRDVLQKMFLGGERIFVNDKKRGVLASRLASELNRTIVFDKCEGDCIDLSEKSIDEIKNMYKSLGKTNYFILANEDRENSLLAAQLSVFRRGMPIFVNLNGISYPSPSEGTRVLDEYNRNNKLSYVRSNIKDNVEEFTSLDRNYVYGEMPKLIIIGDGNDVPYFLIKDFGLEDIVREPSGNELWLKTDNYYGDLNDDGFLDLAVGRINKDVEGGSKQIFEIREFEKNKNKGVGILSEYNHILGLDLLTSGGSMFNGFLAENILRNDFKTDRLVEHRFYATDEDIDDKLTKKVLDVIINFLKLNKMKGAMSKLVFSQKLLYLLLERDWNGWEVGTIPLYLQEISKELSSDFFREKSMVFFFGPGDTNKMFFYDDLGEDRDLVTDPYSGPELDIRDIGKAGFLFLDYSYSARANVTQNSPGFIGNNGLLHDLSSRDTIFYFLKNLDWGAGQALSESKNNILGALRYKYRVNASSPYRKEAFEKILLSDPALNITSKAKPHKGFYCARRYNNEFMDEVDITPSYDVNNGNIIFYNYTSLLLESNRPMLSVYTKSIIIPSGAKISNIKVEKQQKIIENITIPFFRDEYYEEKNFTGIYPDEEWWKNERDFLDGRKEIIFSVPVRYDTKNKEAVVNNFNFKVVYNSSLEVTKFYTMDIIKGERQRFYLDIYTNKQRESKIFLRVYGSKNDEITKNVTLKKGENSVEICWNDTGNTGKYTAEVVVISDVVMGPRSLDFSILRKPNIFKSTAYSIVQVWKDLADKLTRIFQVNNINLEKEMPESKIYSWVEDGKRISEMKTNEFDLRMEASGNESKITFTSSLGKIIITKVGGNKKEMIYGDPKLRYQYNDARKIFEKALNKINR